jgi:hypothetical protein
MKADLRRLLADATLVTLALAIALGWSLYQFAQGAATFVDALTTNLPAGTHDSVPYFDGGGLTWFVGDRIVTLDGMVRGAIEVGVVVLVAVVVRRVVSHPSADDPDSL